MTSFRGTPTKPQTEQMVERQALLNQLRSAGKPQPEYSELFSTSLDVERVGKTNCENLVGSIELPVGVAGPVKVFGAGLDESVIIPLATSEGALVASINRGAKALDLAGGVSVMTKKIGMSRAPVFECQSGAKAWEFQEWVQNHQAEIKALTEATSSHLTFTELQTWVRGRYVFVRFVFDTNEAMGMNMVTIALQHWWEQVSANVPEVKMISLSSNVCCDKKDSVINRVYGRGYWVQAEAVLPEAVLRNILKTDVGSMEKIHVVKNLIGSNLAGSHSQNMQVANIAAAFLAATGQDLAHVVEATQASTSMEPVSAGLYVAVTLPNLNFGTVGGGTWLPAQAQARQVITSSGKVTGEQLAAVMAVAALAGEISGLSALATHTLAQAHQRLGRNTSNS